VVSPRVVFVGKGRGAADRLRASTRKLLDLVSREKVAQHRLMSRRVAAVAALSFHQTQGDSNPGPRPIPYSKSPLAVVWSAGDHREVTDFQRMA